MKTSLYRFSPKQLKLLGWWHDPKLRRYDGIICDGAVRSGKSTCMSLSFVLWGITAFKDGRFGMCGKTIVSIRRNVLEPLKVQLSRLGFTVKDDRVKNTVDITLGQRKMKLYLFGGKDEGSAALIQGVTLCGVYLDEAVLMPRSFVEQAVARCSVSGSKLWFNCNPDNPYHWFKLEWIDKAEQKNILHLHFLLTDNPSLSPEMIERYETLYSGAFYERFVLGKWSAVTGAVYSGFSQKRHVFDTLPADVSFVRFAASCDYGTVNPTSIGLWGITDTGKAYRLKEYYYASRITGQQRTDEEHYAALEKLCAGFDIDVVVCDPSARSFIECIRRHGKFSVKAAKNDVVYGIRRVSDLLCDGRLFFSSSCKDTLREFSLYRWDDNCRSDVPVKENDHAMDDIRYFAVECMGEKSGFYALSVDRA